MQLTLIYVERELPTDTEVEAFNKALVLHADHELNACIYCTLCRFFFI